MFLIATRKWIVKFSIETCSKPSLSIGGYLLETAGSVFPRTKSVTFTTSKPLLCIRLITHNLADAHIGEIVLRSENYITRNCHMLDLQG